MTHSMLFNVALSKRTAISEDSCDTFRLGYCPCNVELRGNGQQDSTHAVDYGVDGVVGVDHEAD